MDAAMFLALALQCAPHVAPDTLLAIASHESALRPYIIANNSTKERAEGATAAEATERASMWIAAGHSVDMGLMQINSLNLPRLGLTVADVFVPCTNVQAGARVLGDAYTEARQRQTDGALALRMALSAYNTGNFNAGFLNGYVAAVEGQAAAYAVPSLSGAAPSTPPALRVRPASPAKPTQPVSAPAPGSDWNPFGRSDRGSVF
jgi:type IV secretion system protein VirB1